MTDKFKAADDPLAAIKTMRLQQLAVCRLKTAEEMQAMQEKSQVDIAESAKDNRR